MANNRMFLVYRPTGDAVYLGKRMAYGWYAVPEDLSARVCALFELVEKSSGKSQDDFAIALESGCNQPHAIDKWSYINTDSPVRKLKIDDSVPYGKPENI